MKNITQKVFTYEKRYFTIYMDGYIYDDKSYVIIQFYAIFFIVVIINHECAIDHSQTFWG